MNQWKQIKKTRKEHVCHGCREKIPTGSSCVNNVGVFEGNFYSIHYCEDCNEFIGKHPDYFEEGIEFGGVKEARFEMAR